MSNIIDDRVSPRTNVRYIKLLFEIKNIGGRAT